MRTRSKFGRMSLAVAFLTCISALDASAADPPGSSTEAKDPFVSFKESLKKGQEDQFLLNGFWVSEEDLRAKWDQKSGSRPTIPANSIARQRKNQDLCTLSLV